MKQSDSRRVLAKAIAIAGSQRALAVMCGYTQHGIWYAYKKGTITDELAKAIHKALDGAISKKELRPDLWAE